QAGIVERARRPDPRPRHHAIRQLALIARHVRIDVVVQHRRERQRVVARQALARPPAVGRHRRPLLHHHRVPLVAPRPGREYEGRGQHVLLATFVFSTRSWRYKGYSVMVKERPAMSTNSRWSRECLPCHNTLPLATMLYDDIDPHVPSYQGKLSDRVMPRSRIWPARALDDAGL